MSSLQSGLVPATQEQTLALTFTGPFGSGQASSVLLKRFGNLVFLEFPQVSAAAAIASVGTMAAAIPAGFRPLATLYQAIPIISNSVVLPAAGKCELLANGNINIYLDLVGTGAWGAIGNNGWQRFSVAYCIA